MREATIISELRSALWRRGVWGARGERLIQEWTEHVRADTAQRVEKGATPDAAEEAAWQALGTPKVLAVSAARELNSVSWLGRHPWLGGLVLPVVVWFALTYLALFLPYWALRLLWHTETFDFHHPAALATELTCWTYVVNWLPWLLSMAWLARLAVRMPGGWKLFWITAVVLTLCSTSLWMSIQPLSRGSGNSLPIFCFPTGPLGVIAHPLLQDSVPPPAKLTYVGPSLLPWIQMIISVIGALAFYFKATAPSRATDEALSS